MGLSQANAARRLNVSRSVVQRLWDQYQSEDSVSRRPVQPRATTPAEDRFLSFGTKEKNHYCASARCRPFSSIRKKNLRYYGAKSSSNAGLYARRPVVCVPLNGRQRRNRLFWARETCFLDVGFCAVLNEFRFTMDDSSTDLEGTAH
ncbi:HTH_Tnp_Tc3_2 domain-containing protein [Trichonephila clavipes]|nr:HTH_Tnp_Tc3_2 domain-containing protein [Trichonephila clavipes]